ncbi:SpdA protein [Streptomyces sp. MUSC 125]|uniref:DUF2637 domain-containing protein n=1 Tax=unclassified Streptomyces TaxID=2593676 RepID=UPI00057D6D1B|nr:MULTISPECIES: DUF2637 domain-containing protein [unclassified Streptomyces]KIE25899.1 SpdA protein [Streptomyces sp. MUSC 125]MCH0559807.1 DUF2637 domain-containing protein [Streptomyces sp. MUM 16J]
MARPALRADAVLVQAVIAGALSFAHLHDLAAAAGQTGWKAWAYPVSVDLLLVAAWHRLRNGGSKPAAWCWFVVALTASLGANVATAGLLDLADVPAWLRILVAGWPAVAFLGGTLLAHGSRTQTPEPTPLPVPADNDEPGASTTSAPEPHSASVPTPAPAPVPPALVALARKVADEHKARTGTAIDTSTLRSRLGVPLPLAEAITTRHLT